MTLYAVLPVLLLGLPTVMMGLSFGYLQRAVQRDLDRLGRRVGWLQAANIAGAMAGALATGLLLLDWLGTSGTLRLIVCSSIVFLFFAAYIRRDYWRVSAGAMLGVCVIAYVIPSASLLWARLHGAVPRQIIHGEDGSGVSVLKLVLEGQQTVVYANGLGQSTLPYGGLHSVLGALPAMIHPDPRTVAVIGLGSGDTLVALGGVRESRLSTASRSSPRNSTPSSSSNEFGPILACEACCRTAEFAIGSRMAGRLSDTPTGDTTSSKPMQFVRPVPMPAICNRWSTSSCCATG